MRFTLSKLSLAIMATSLAMPVFSEEVQEETTERISVTGSRIKQNSAQMATPTTVIDAATIAQFGVKNIGELMNKLPALMDGISGGNTNHQNGGNTNNAGLELANLRGLGTNRTLVLIDGRRQVAGSAGTASVDMSTIPTSMVERLEIITGGASAIYGADAVTGVVNFIMKKDFEGFEFEASYGETSEGDGEKEDLSLTWGKNFSKGNFAINASYSDQGEIAIADRAYANVNPAFTNHQGMPVLHVDQRFQALSEEGLFYVPNSDYIFDGTHEAPWGGNQKVVDVNNLSST